ncbi:RimK family alpha-L-glutamate ligase [Streptosporangium lutulentum]
MTFADADGSDDEKEIALAAWGEVGITGRAVRWDDPAVDWAAFDVVVVRTPWDYVYRRAEFVSWAHRVESVTRMLNPAAVLERNTDKTYLRDLEAPTIPTSWVAPGEPVEFPILDEYVVKPAISAGARGTIRTGDRKKAEAHVAQLVAEGQTAMIQPYLDMVEAEGRPRCSTSAAGSAMPYGVIRCWPRASPGTTRRAPAPSSARPTPTSSPSPSGFSASSPTCSTPAWTWSASPTALRSSSSWSSPSPTCSCATRPRRRRISPARWPRPWRASRGRRCRRPPG